MDWFLYDIGLRHERVKWICYTSKKASTGIFVQILISCYFFLLRMLERFNILVLIKLKYSAANFFSLKTEGEIESGWSGYYHFHSSQ